MGVIIALLVGIALYLLAQGSNKNPNKAFLAGFVSVILTVITFGIVKKVKEKKQNK
jgi:hypothetical protein